MNTDFNMGRWMEYIGKNPVYQGKQALLRPVYERDQQNVLIQLNPQTHIMAQFPDVSPDWVVCPKKDFQRPGSKPVF